MIQANIAEIREHIEASCARRASGGYPVTFIAVTKTVDAGLIREVLASGVADVGENRVQDAMRKKLLLSDVRAAWHLVGHLQTNKVRDAVAIFDLIHSLDSEKLALEIDRQAAKAGKVQRVLVEVNISGESQKYGVPPDDLSRYLERIKPLANIQVEGLMGMAPLAKDSEAARPYFRRLRELFDTLRKTELVHPPMRHLSMGMSQDFAIAVEEGATMVRVGTAIFGERGERSGEKII